MSNELETMSVEELLRANGGVKMKLTQYGYPNDPYSDSYTRAGKGAYRDLDRNHSMAITDSGLAALGLSRQLVRKEETWVNIRTQGGGVLTRRIDDRAPQKDYRADLYMPRGFDHSLPDYADVTVRR